MTSPMTSTVPSTVPRTVPPTEQSNPASARLGALSAREVVALMNVEERRVLVALDRVAAELATVAERLAAGYLAGGRAVLIGAGTGGRLALAEFAEVEATFGIAAERLLVLVAGRAAVDGAAVAATEDDTEAAPAALAAAGVGTGDVVIGVAASGTTPFVRSGVLAARAAGAWTAALANNPAAALLADADLGVCLDTGPEVLTGSTRLKAGTAQKLALNRITTAAMVLAGKVVGNHMVDVVVSNAKLRERAIRIVTDLAGVEPADAAARLGAHEWSVREVLRELGLAHTRDDMVQGTVGAARVRA